MATKRRTSILLDEALLKKARKTLKASTNTEAITKALQDYKSGARSGGGVAAMAEVTYPLSEQEIAALAHYVARFR